MRCAQTHFFQFIHVRFSRGNSTKYAHTEFSVYSLRFSLAPCGQVETIKHYRAYDDIVAASGLTGTHPGTPLLARHM